MNPGPPELDIEPHPLVALPRPMRPGTIPLPSPRGEARKSGALSQGALRTTRAVAEALFSRGGHAPPVERMDWAMDEYADLMARTTSRGRLMFWAAAAGVGWLAPLMIRRLTPLADLPLPDRIRALQALEASPLAGVLIALRALLCIVYYEHPDVARAAGLPMGPLRGGR
jgi:hypothetical protein